MTTIICHGCSLILTFDQQAPKGQPSCPVCGQALPVNVDQVVDQVVEGQAPKSTGKGRK